MEGGIELYNEWAQRTEI